MKIFIGSYMAQLNHMADYLNQYEWEFVDPPPKLTICPVCSEVLKKPMLTECCGSHFCKACIQPPGPGSHFCKACIQPPGSHFCKACIQPPAW